MADYEARAKFFARYESQRFNATSRQEFLTPGVDEVLALVADHCRPHDGLVLEVAFGKGEAACRLAEAHGATVVGVDMMRSMCKRAADKARSRRLGGRVHIVRGAGAFLPLRDGHFDIVLCTGAPSIAGGDEALAEMRRILKPGGWLAVSDWVWRKRPIPPEVVPSSAGSAAPVLLEEYAATIRAAGFEVVLAQSLPAAVWDAYYGPMLENVDAIRQEHAGDPEVQAWAESVYANEPKYWYEAGAREYWAYAAFLGRKV